MRSPQLLDVHDWVFALRIGDHVRPSGAQRSRGATALRPSRREKSAQVASILSRKASSKFSHPNFSFKRKLDNLSNLNTVQLAAS